MIEIQCTSCHTRYRIDERVLPEDTPTFKCSRCGHVFSAEPRGRRRPAARGETNVAAEQAGAALLRPTSRRAITPRPSGPPSPRPSMPAADPVAPAKSAPTAAPEVSEATPAPEVAVPPPTPKVSAPIRAPEVSLPPSKAQPAPQSDPPPADQGRSFDPPAPEENAPSGENLAFDFDDEPSFEERREPDPPADRRYDDWQVGEAPTDLPGHLGPISSPVPPEPEPAAATDEGRFADEEAPLNQRAAIPERPPYVPDHARVHSTGFLLGLFVLVVLAFGAGSLLICNAPVASAEFLNTLPIIAGRFAPPIVPARLVAIKDVITNYRAIKGNRTLVVTGTAINVGNAPLHTVQLVATLIDSARRPVAGGTVFCGNNLAPAMIDEMTPRELEFFQRLEPPKHFVLKPLTPTAFTMVFINPPATVSSLSISVSKAVAASPDELAEDAPAN
ncbi:MAG TPA: zinc-ribbon domain-containing protein [Candidatus Binataceae bacterium]|nr:zinc-ribbon domain-containing protein [Candidatus Binataceae bacterium]